jgi:hypothetical protein
MFVLFFYRVPSVIFLDFESIPRKKNPFVIDTHLFLFIKHLPFDRNTSIDLFRLLTLTHYVYVRFVYTCRSCSITLSISNERAIRSMWLRCKTLNDDRTSRQSTIVELFRHVILAIRVNSMFILCLIHTMMSDG